MDYQDLGDFYRVNITEGEVMAFKRSWPASGLEADRPLTFAYNKETGDLVDQHPHPENMGEDLDEAALVALSVDAQRWAEGHTPPFWADQYAETEG